MYVNTGKHTQTHIHAHNHARFKKGEGVIKDETKKKHIILPEGLGTQLTLSAIPMNTSNLY